MNHPDPMTLEEVRSLTATLDTTSGCACPGCPEKVEYRSGVRGRRQRFCSGACRAKHSRERNRLHRLLARAEATYRRADPPLPAEEIEHLEAHITWLLDGYGGVDRSLMFNPMAPPWPFRSLSEFAEECSRRKQAQLEELRVITGDPTLTWEGVTNLASQDTWV